ncbi:DUF4870 domain-containing protein [Paenibacillus humicola]|uniref:DUF4870 domain-containing protein n=1 Tax=Paenibacillus humicola TaxID=3110540 RepID=UPI00237B71A6|nr:DUF4870 domain-containing protein [Paenibacillus humicola]
MQSPYMAPDPSSTGINPKLLGLICYLGCFVTGFLLLIFEKKSRFVKFHAMQSVIGTVAVMIINIVLGFIPIIGWLAGVLFAPLTLILWVLLMLYALQGRWFKLPFIGSIAEQQSRLF